MSLPFETPLALALLGLLTCACTTPETANDELGNETTGTESGDATDETEFESSSEETDATESSSDDVDTVDTTDGTDGEPCECIAEQAEGETPMMPICGDELCGEVLVADDPMAEFGEKLVTTPEELECALTALRDRTPGIVTWSGSFNGGQFSDNGYILIYADGQAVRREWGANDLSYDVDPALRFDLLDPQHYTDCLALPTDDERYSCLRAYPSPNPPPVVCEAGWSESDS